MPIGTGATTLSLSSAGVSGTLRTGTGATRISFTDNGNLNVQNFTPAQRALVQGSTANHFAKFEIEDPDGNWKDTSTGLSTPDWFNAITISDSVDQNTMSMNASLLRDTAGLSLAPLLEASTLNRDALSAYAPMLDLARKWRISVDVTAPGGSPTYKEIGRGYIDTIQVNDYSDTIDLVGRGEEAPLIQHYVTTATDYATTGVGIPIETILQDMLDAELGVLAPTIYVPAPMNYEIGAVGAITLEEGNLLPSLSKIAAMCGAVLRYRYDEANVNRLTLYKPEREAEAGDEDWSINSDEYLSIPVNTLDIDGVRNKAIVRYTDETSGEIETVIWNSTTYSQTRYGVLPILIDLSEESQVTTYDNALLLAQAVVSDLEIPILQQRIETYGFWFVRLQDYGKTVANGVHYDVDQYGGVTAFSHRIENGTIRTSIDLGGAPRGGFRRWFPWGQKTSTMKPKPPTPVPTIPPFVPPNSTLIAWFDASQETTYVNNDDVSIAHDWSGNVKNATNTQGTSFQPIYVTGATPSGLAAFQFGAGSNANGISNVDLDTDAAAGQPEYLRTALLGTPTAGMTIVTVGRANGTVVEHTGFYRGATAAASAMWLKLLWTGNPATTTQLYWDPAGGGTAISSSNGTNWFIHVVRFESASLARQWHNGIEASPTWDPDAGFDNQIGMVLGNGNVQIAEMRIYSGLVSSAAIQGVVLELFDKHGI